MLSIIVLATLCGVVRGQRDLAAFAATLSQAQLRALRCYKGRDGRYHSPKETTFFRILSQMDTACFERALLAWEERCLGPRDLSVDSLLAIDGKAQRGSTPCEQWGSVCKKRLFPTARRVRRNCAVRPSIRC